MLAKSIITAEHLTRRVMVGREPLTILEDVSLNIEPQESLAILGVSGSGKSTLLGLLAGLDLPTEGRILVEGVDMTKLSENDRAALRINTIGFIFQNFQLLPSLTALENVLLPLELHEVKDAEKIARTILDEVGLKQRLNHYPKQLSGGEQQRVAIARAFALRPKILFADEPTGNLDQKTAMQIIEMLFELNRVYETTLVCVTHDPLLSSQCKRLLHLSGGQLVA